MEQFFRQLGVLRTPLTSRSVTVLPLMKSGRIVVALVLLVLWCLLGLALAQVQVKDPYRVLGVSRRASTDEIRKAYKKLAMKYHPDKSQDSNSEQRMMEITAAHDILSDDAKRREYDQTGGVGAFEQQQQQQRQHGGRQFDPFSNFFAHGSAHHHFSGEDPSASASISLIKENYDHLVTQDTNNVWLIQFISRFCSGCKSMASPWEQAIRDSNGLLKVGRIHYDNQPSLARQFNLRHIPTVIAIYKGAQATLSFSGAMEDLNSNHLLDFAATLLSVRIPLLTVNQAETFMKTPSSKVKVLLIHTQRSVPLVFKVIANKLSEHFSYGMVATNVDNPAYNHLLQIFGLHGRSLPMLVLQKEGSTAPIIRDFPGELTHTHRRELLKFLTSHQQLLVPTVTADNYYPLCFEPRKHVRPTCVLILGSDTDGIASTLTSLYRDHFQDRIQFGRISPLEQPEFCRFFGAFHGSTRVLTIRPVQQKYHLYKGKTDSQSISDYLTKVAENQIEFSDGLANGGLPFLTEVSPSLLDSLSESMSFIVNPVRRMLNSASNWVGASEFLTQVLPSMVPLLMMAVFMILPGVFR